MRFTKMQGLGNDYIYLDCTHGTPDDLPRLAVKMSDRHFGIGSDGLICICPSETADFRMRMFNADGSEGEMCGNGIRCVGKFVYDKGLTDKTDITVISAGKIKYLTLFVNEGKVETVKVNMGAPELTAALVPVLCDSVQAVDEPITVRGRAYKMTCVSMGNPHAVVFLDDVENLAIEEIGPYFESHERFPKRTNTEFVNVIDRNTVQMRVWERGTGETLACGTGACATVVACVLNGLTEETVKVKLLGGDLTVTWDREADLVYMTGPAVTVFEGII